MRSIKSVFLLATLTVSAISFSGNDKFGKPLPPEQRPDPTSAIDICFSPGNCDQKLIAFINSAQSTLDIAIYSLTHDGITAAIENAHKRGVEVRLVVDKSQSSGNSSTVADLDSAGISVKIGNQKGIMHNKFTVVDGKRVETGSFNYSSNATSNNAENQIYLSDAVVAQKYEMEFDHLWKIGKEFDGKAGGGATKP